MDLLDILILDEICRNKKSIYVGLPLTQNHGNCSCLFMYSIWHEMELLQATIPPEKKKKSGRLGTSSFPIDIYSCSNLLVHVFHVHLYVGRALSNPFAPYQQFERYRPPCSNKNKLQIVGERVQHDQLPNSTIVFTAALQSAINRSRTIHMFFSCLN